MKKIISVILLLLAIGISYKGIYELLKERSDAGGTYQFECFYKQPKDSVDVLFVGSSRVFCNIEPSVLWNEYGISSYDLATNSQRIHLSYYAIKEALKYQHPKLVVLEMSKRDHIDGYEDEDQTMSMQNGMRFSLNKMQALFLRSIPENRIDYLLGLPCYHTRYNELTKEDFIIYDFDNMYPTTKMAGHKGGVELFNISSFGSFPDEINVVEEDVIELFSSSMDKIVDLCDKENIELLLLYTPNIERTEYTSISKYANDNNLKYINCNEILGDIGMNPNEDFADEGHLNYLGASKVSKYIGKYIVDNYAVKDHRGDKAFASWDENANYVDSLYKAAIIKYITGMGDYFDNFPDDNYLVIVSLLGNYKEIDMGAKGVLEKLGCSNSAYEEGGTFILDGGNIVNYIPKGSSCNNTIKIGKRKLRVDIDNGDRSIRFDEKECAVKDSSGELMKNGIEVIVYNKRNQQVVDSVCFDSDNNYLIVRQ